MQFIRLTSIAALMAIVSALPVALENIEKRTPEASPKPYEITVGQRSAEANPEPYEITVGQ